MQDRLTRARVRTPQVRRASGVAGGTTSRSAATSGASTSTSNRSRIRAAAFRSRARPPVPTSPTFCSAFRTRARLRSATPTSTCARSSYDAYVTDDWRVSPSFDDQRRRALGVRGAAHGERGTSRESGRRARISGSGARRGVESSRPSDRSALSGLAGASGQRGVAAARRRSPGGRCPGSSLVVRAGYGIYRNTTVYQSIATLLAQQPPLSKTFSVRTAQSRLHAGQRIRRRPAQGRRTRSRSIRTSASGTRTTGRCRCSAICPASLTIIATYLGTKGSHLMQEFLPNTYPAGAANPCPSVRPGSSTWRPTAARRDTPDRCSCAGGFATG